MSAFGKAEGGGRRRSSRASAAQLAVLSTISSDTRVGLMNVSSRGVRVTAPELPAQGEDVLFQADSIQLFGQVAWARGSQCGVTFLSPMSPDEVEQLKREASSQEPFQLD